MMTSAQVVETSVSTTDNSPSQDYTHLDDQTTILRVTPGSNHLLYESISQNKKHFPKTKNTFPKHITVSQNT